MESEMCLSISARGLLPLPPALLAVAADVLSSGGPKSKRLMSLYGIVNCHSNMVNIGWRQQQVMAVNVYRERKRRVQSRSAARYSVISFRGGAHETHLQEARRVTGHQAC